MVRSRFAAQMELLNTELIVMGTLCENALEHVMQALQEDNDALNREIIILGKRTEEKEREVENICINLLLKQQPVASDLRQISAALKMITDLSRIGEQPHIEAMCRSRVGKSSASASFLLFWLLKMVIRSSWRITPYRLTAAMA